MFGGIHLLVSHVLARIVNNNFANLEKQKRQHSVPVMGGSVVAIAEMVAYFVGYSCYDYC